MRLTKLDKDVLVILQPLWLTPSMLLYELAEHRGWKTKQKARIQKSLDRLLCEDYIKRYNTTSGVFYINTNKGKNAVLEMLVMKEMSGE